MEDILTLDIRVDSAVTVNGHFRTVVMVRFSGTCSGEYFNGEILPGAVDTQTYFPDGKGVLSARYALKGRDSAGNECMMFIENSTAKDGIGTTPVVTTDSSTLSWLEDTPLHGEVEIKKEDQIVIHIGRKN